MKKFDLLNTGLAGRNLIEASAGTGKTFTIAGVYLRLVLELRLKVSEILVVTFTEAATKELKERIRKRLKEAEEAFAAGQAKDPLFAGLLERHDHGDAKRLLASAVRSFDEAAIFTIHGFCQRILQEHPFESGSLCDTELLTDQGMVLREIAQDYWRIKCYVAPRERVAAAADAGISAGSLLALARRVGADPFATVIPASPAATDDLQDWLFALKRGFFAYLAEELPKRKQARNVRCFDDLLLDLHDALVRPGSTLPRLIRDRYKAGLIDEFQDTDPLQFAIFNSIYPKMHPAPFFLIGDPKQAIYSFRGADIFAYIGAARETDSKHTLLENWRSEPPLITAVNSIFKFRDLPFLFEDIPFTAVQAAKQERKILTEKGVATPPLKFWFTPRKQAGSPINKGDAWEMLPEMVASEICRLLKSGEAGNLSIGDSEGKRGVAPGDIAVLVRANRQAKLMQRALTRRGIPSVLCSAGNLFESEEAAELLRILSAVAEPGHEALLRGALATDLVGVCGDELAQLMGDETGWEQVLEEFRSYHETWKASGCMAMSLRFMEKRMVRERLLSAPMGERRLTNLLHTVETLHQAQVEGHLGMEGVIAWLACRITEEPKREEHEIRLETDEAAVQLVTIHKSKGLEYPIVFLPFCWAEFGGKYEGALYHDEDGRVVLDIGSPELARHKEQARQEALAESLRLLYVALTRGKHRTYLIWGAFKDAGDSAMHYLMHRDGRPSRGQVTLSDEAMLAELRELASTSGGAIDVLTIPAADREFYLAETADELKLKPREFKGAIPRDWRVTSFTSLATTQHHGAELPDRDEAHIAEPQAAAPAEATGIFAFPRGAKAGIFLHEIFEEHDFTAPREELDALVAELLMKHGFAAEWKGAVSSMMQSVLKAPLGEDPFTLAQIGMDRRLTELEFFFPLAAVTSERLREAVSAYAASTAKSKSPTLTTPSPSGKRGSLGSPPCERGDRGDLPLSSGVTSVASALTPTPLPEGEGLVPAVKGRRDTSGSPEDGREVVMGGGVVDFAELFTRLSFSPVQGMLRGFMDLVVEHGGKYFILDWKSNHLGNRVEDYDRAGMMREMEHNLYPLQYLLYTVALDSYLKFRIPDYDYDRHFGGVFYVFLRGVDGKGNGIFADRPPKTLIEELSHVLRGAAAPLPAPPAPVSAKKAAKAAKAAKATPGYDGEQGVLPF